MIRDMELTNKLKVIDRLSYQWPLVEWDKTVNCKVRILYAKNDPIGFSLFRVGFDHLNILRLVVRPEFQGHGYGSKLHNDLLLRGIRKQYLMMVVWERNNYLEWLKRRGWKAQNMVRGVFSPDSGILMTRSLS